METGKHVWENNCSQGHRGYTGAQLVVKDTVIMAPPGRVSDVADQSLWSTQPIRMVLFW
jgi:hypothetical protein